MNSNLFIHGGAVMDGSGAPPCFLDLLIQGDRIVWIGPPGKRSAGNSDRAINATGRVVAPGFIDAHAHGDPFSTPGFTNYLAQGVTTILLGQDGDSPPHEDLTTWMDAVDREAAPAVNIALFAGHGTIRRLSGVGLDKPASPDGIDRMIALTDAAMRAGCLGMTTGLEYEPGYQANLDELAALAAVVGRAGGLVMSHLRSEDNDTIETALNELLEQGRRGRCPVHVSHLKIVHGRGRDRAQSLLDQFEAARRAGIRVTADLYPYTASCTTIGILFPDWARPPHDYRTVVATRRSELAEHLRRIVARRNGPEATLLTTPPMAGQTLAQAASAQGKPFEDLLIDDIGPSGAGAAYFVMDAEVMEHLYIAPFVMLSSDGSPTMRHPRGYGAFAKAIREFAVERRLLPLEEVIWKMTGLTARTTGLDRIGRGLLKPGFFADLVIFDPARVKDHATFEHPYQPAAGFDVVVVNGSVAWEDGQPSEARPGRMLRKTASFASTP